MSKQGLYIDAIRALDDRFDDIEKLIKMILLHNLMGEVETIACVQNRWISDELKEFLGSYNLIAGSFEKINGIDVCNISVPATVRISVKEVMHITDVFKSIYEGVMPIFRYEKINGMQRKRLLQEGISFSVVDKELHVFSSRRQCR